MTSSTSPSKARRSGVTISRWSGIVADLLSGACSRRRRTARWRSRFGRAACAARAPASRRAERPATEASCSASGGAARRRPVGGHFAELGRVGADVVEGTGQEERLLGQVVDLAFEDLLERGDRVPDRHVGAGPAGEDLGHVERLAVEDLQAPRPGDRGLVLLGQLVDAQDRDDVLQVAVALQDALDLAGRVVVLLARRRADRGRARWRSADRRPGRCPARRSRAPGGSSSRGGRRWSPAPGRCSRPRARRPPGTT